MSNFNPIIKNEEYKQFGFPKAPAATNEIAYVMYKANDPKKFVAITAKTRVFSAEIRAAKYNKLMTIALSEFTANQNYKIECQEENHWFQIAINFRFSVQDVGGFFQKNTNDLFFLICQQLRDVEKDFSKKYSFRSLGEFKNSLSDYVRESLTTLDFLKIIYSIDVTLDKAAQVILETEANCEVDIASQDAEAIKAKVQLTNELEINQLKKEQEKVVAELDNEIQNIKVSNIDYLLNAYGDGVGVVLDHIDGAVTGTDLTNHRINQKQTNFNMQLDTIIRLHKEGILSEEQLERMTMRIMLADNSVMGISSNQVNNRNMVEQNGEEYVVESAVTEEKYDAPSEENDEDVK